MEHVAGRKPWGKTKTFMIGTVLCRETGGKTLWIGAKRRRVASSVTLGGIVTMSPYAMSIIDQREQMVAIDDWLEAKGVLCDE